MKYNIEEWEFKELHAWMDGGSITLNYFNKKGEKSTIDIVQNVVGGYYKELSKIPGRIYVNDELIVIRSNEEIRVLKKLEIEIANLKTQNEKNILIEKIDWIESEKYINFNPTTLVLSEERKRNLRD